ncbi:hypothetical protein AGABI1DRAFT_113028 [Agaricus bisporus var. burnettii JB137-S8]|uniref:Uncharacterized protein n=1 Tax=Agaricus bisporus var. burnettii (strain JB137-S8 / ATCC MYA-4627 / FGSC 10392) TaxID=597362 RepID=K5X0Q1_AGABU|nr:uncharacterized protein AGABI1DRAFT_113028 [Agaricus bisporus var. burnettii JB137-S8]EKM81386.1 hypothetical protein AGABI1DRAFT_113028 [Agaricus bisporus var. burnettii JB137-S8]
MEGLERGQLEVLEGRFSGNRVHSAGMQSLKMFKNDRFGERRTIQLPSGIRRALHEVWALVKKR